MRIIDRIYSGLILNLVWCFGVVVGIMPRFVWVLLSEILYFLLYIIFRYRLKVVRENLTNSFPEKSQQELEAIEREFYSSLSDIFVEIIALAGVPRRRLERYMVFKDMENLERDSKKGSVIIAMAHYGNWEWATVYAGHTDSALLPVYNPLKTKWADDLFLRIRKRFGATPVPMKMVGRKMVEMRDKNVMLALISDQAAPPFEKGNWIEFFHQDTKFYFGMEQLSVKYGTPIYFFNMKRVRKFCYEADFIKIYDGVEQLEQGAITLRYKDILERTIINNPAMWMWSHRRWKFKRVDNEYN